MKPTEQLHELGQSIWLDNITRKMLGDGTLRRYVEELSVTGLTSNPTIFDKAIVGGSDYDEQIAAASPILTAEQVFFELALRDLREAADLFAPAHAGSDGVDGWVSLEVSPLLADDTAATIEQAAKLHGEAERDNLFVKIPGTRAGLPAIEESIFAGVPINVTLLFSVGQYVMAAEAYLRGIERRVEAGLDPDVASVASIFVSRWDVAVADRVPDELRNRLGIAVAGQAYAAYRRLPDSERWQRLADEGARPQRLLFASTGAKDPQLPAGYYVEALQAPDTIDTMPEATLLSFARLGAVANPLTPYDEEHEATLAEFAAAGVDVEELATRLQEEGKRSFDDSWKELLASIESERTRLEASG
jgi:transaldolase